MKSVRHLLVLAALVLPVPSLHAGFVTVGTQSPGPTGENCIPFGCPSIFAVTRYQQVYSSTAFPGQIEITAITFFNTTSAFPPESNEVTPGTYTFSFSTTSKAVSGLDSTDMDDNVGADSQPFFSGVLSGPLAGTELTVVGTPFAYDPSLGNLLLNIELSGLGIDTFIFLDNEAGSPVMGRAFAGEPSTLNGLVTRFQTEAASVPVPGTLALLCIGIAASCLRRGRFSLQGA